MMNSPHVIVKSQYTPSYNNLTYKFNNSDKVKKDVLKMFDYYANEKKKLVTMFDYFDGTIGKDKKMNMCFKMVIILQKKKNKKDKINIVSI